MKSNSRINGKALARETCQSVYLSENISRFITGHHGPMARSGLRSGENLQAFSR
jgi:hypothetical protein